MKYLIFDPDGPDYAKTDDPELAKKLANRYLVIDIEHETEIGGKSGADIPIDEWIWGGS